MVLGSDMYIYVRHLVLSKALVIPKIVIAMVRYLQSALFVVVFGALPVPKG